MSLKVRKGDESDQILKKRLITVRDSDLIGETVTIWLYGGWNLISVPLRLFDNSTENVLSPLEGLYSVVWSYQNGTWLMYDPQNKMMSDLNEIGPGYGYWIRMNEDATPELQGIAVDDPIFLKKGWNLTGYNSFAYTPVIDAPDSVWDHLEEIRIFRNDQWKQNNPSNPELNDFENMAPHYGYRIRVNGDCTLTMP